jgi:hypothetical protein
MGSHYFEAGVVAVGDAPLRGLIGVHKELGGALWEVPRALGSGGAQVGGSAARDKSRARLASCSVVTHTWTSLAATS